MSIRRNLLTTQHEHAGHCGAHGCHCSNNPTLSSCPVNRAYALLDPNVSDYSSLDCSVVVYDVQQMLQQLDDDEVAAEVREELAQCPCGAELVDVESKLRGKLHDACEEHAPDNLRLRLLSHIRCACGEDPARDDHQGPEGEEPTAEGPTAGDSSSTGEDTSSQAG